MEETKTKYILVALVVIVLVAASVGFYLIKDAGVEGITALEGKPIADAVSKNWSKNATLITLRKGSDMLSEGHFSAWFYVYINNNTIENSTKVIEIRTFSSGETIIEEFNGSNYGDKKPFGEWTIDSDEVYEIARENSDIKNFLDRTPSLDSFFLGSSTGEPIWILKWVDPGFMDDPKWAQIHIDANTGEVLYVEADN